MTEHLPPLAVDHSPLWIQLELSGDPSWAWPAAAQLLARPQLARYRTAAGEKQLTAMLKRAGAIARAQGDPTLGFILAPAPEEGIKGTATLSPVSTEGKDADRVVADLAEQLAPTLPAGEKPEITRMQTPAGECRRVRTRYAVDGQPGGRLGEQIGYLWVFEDYGAARCLMMSFTSLPEAERWLPALDELAAGVRLKSSRGGPDRPAPEAATVAGAGGSIEIRPVRPEGKLLPGERRTLSRWVLGADMNAGTLTLSGDRPFGGKPKVFRLPTTGDPAAVTTVCLATHRWQTGLNSGSVWRMLFLGRENQLVGAGISRDHPQVLRLFPPEVFDPLKGAGVAVVSEWYDSVQALEEAHPGAAGKVERAGASQGRMAAIGLTIALVMIVIGAAFYIAAH